ncbi:hypothetical protein B0H17DRAFT_1105106 [Mycena rosella]|uniref:Uncharacterized protein n=1 Tax=Mycena rosella TaxID=1033263 RepID=A0AAD7C6Y9_MYCRO|nr:hypothetical protein B0H17DRAFT_1105376 [Mycena rosella]KAJ7640928.1 hypothetical protein B0H17DRAFT_1105106 [Mycena rosella]
MFGTALTCNFSVRGAGGCPLRFSAAVCSVVGTDFPLAAGTLRTWGPGSRVSQAGYFRL